MKPSQRLLIEVAIPIETCQMIHAAAPMMELAMMEMLHSCEVIGEMNLLCCLVLQGEEGALGKTLFQGRAFDSDNVMQTKECWSRAMLERCYLGHHGHAYEGLKIVGTCFGENDMRVEAFLDNF